MALRRIGHLFQGGYWACAELINNGIGQGTDNLLLLGTYPSQLSHGLIQLGILDFFARCCRAVIVGKTNRELWHFLNSVIFPHYFFRFPRGCLPGGLVAVNHPPQLVDIKEADSLNISDRRINIPWYGDVDHGQRTIAPVGAITLFASAGN